MHSYAKARVSAMFAPHLNRVRHCHSGLQARVMNAVTPRR